jgi:hypothetical protein
MPFIEDIYRGGILTLTKAGSTCFAEIGEMFFVMRHGDIAFWTVGNHRCAALPAKLGSARCKKAIVAARAQTVQSCTHPILLSRVLGSAAYLPSGRLK